MKLLSLIAAEVFGLFVDDEFLVVALLALVAVDGSLSLWGIISGAVAGVVLVVGAVVILLGSVARGTVDGKSPLR